MVGIAAFEEQRFQDAIDAWTQLLKTIDPQDPSYAAIETGIERARNSLADNPQSSAVPKSSAPNSDAASDSDYQLRVNVSISAELVEQVAATDTVYVFARAADGPPMPLAAKRLTVADLPAQLVLTDADSLLPQLKLSSVAQLKLQVSVSNTDNAMDAQWSSASVAVDATDTQAQHVLVVDQKK